MTTNPATMTQAERARAQFDVALEAAKAWISEPRNAQTRAAIPLRKFLKAVEAGEMAGPGETVAVPFVIYVSPGRTGSSASWKEAWTNPSIRWDVDGVCEKLARAQAYADLPFRAV